QPGIRINLLKEGRWSANDMKVRIERIPESGLAYRITVEQAPADFQTLAVRVPNWAENMTKTVLVDGKAISDAKAEVVSDGDGEPLLKAYGRSAGHGRIWKAGDVMEIRLTCGLRFVDRNNRTFGQSELPEEHPVEAAVFYGPWLLGVNAHTNPMFHGEPYADNILLFGDEEATLAGISYEPQADPLLNGPRLKLNYQHSGFPDIYTVMLQPVGEQTTHLQTTVSYWHLVKRAAEP
ncbi:MAG TPA: hypothetical protein PLL36_13430, partial [Candidatus Hydrogenedentes bacterium]|nr:hypothetical protein [Candidatus Hydrogenedentota bacterium]